jgi:hypothetical protein
MAHHAEHRDMTAYRITKSAATGQAWVLECVRVDGAKPEPVLQFDSQEAAQIVLATILTRQALRRALSENDYPRLLTEA